MTSEAARRRLIGVWILDTRVGALATGRSGSSGRLGGFALRASYLLAYGQAEQSGMLGMGGCG